jgi:hypothetical protein
MVTGREFSRPFPILWGGLFEIDFYLLLKE